MDAWSTGCLHGASVTQCYPVGRCRRAETRSHGLDPLATKEGPSSPRLPFVDDAHGHSPPESSIALLKFPFTIQSIHVGAYACSISTPPRLLTQLTSEFSATASPRSPPTSFRSFRPRPPLSLHPITRSLLVLDS
jgi:hypothetical protein